MAYPPQRHRASEEAVVRYHRRLAAAGKPLVLFFLYEAAGGVTYSLPVLRELLQIPAVAGIKMATLDSVMTFQDLAGLVRSEAPGQVLITGEDRFLGCSLMCGAQSGLVGMGAACTRMQHDLLRCWQAGDSRGFLSRPRRLPLRQGGA
jgi:4-hydroxy-tetrahydrodipicolinate synthase